MALQAKGIRNVSLLNKECINKWLCRLKELDDLR